MNAKQRYRFSSEYGVASKGSIVFILEFLVTCYHPCPLALDGRMTVLYEFRPLRLTVLYITVLN